jgi:hypothetical protein
MQRLTTHCRPGLSCAAVLQVLKWLLDAGCPVDVAHANGPEDSPLQMACYQVGMRTHISSSVAVLQAVSALLCTSAQDALVRWHHI